MGNIKKNTVKEVKIHKCLVCAHKSQDFAQGQTSFARSHKPETMSFRNSALDSNISQLFSVFLLTD